MAGPIAIDTPDYQRGLVSAQKLLATVPAGTDHVTVGVPPNAETLIVTASNVGTNPTVYAQGTGTLYKFPGKLAIQQPFIGSAPTWFFDVSQSVDPSVLIQFSAAPGDEWYVYADSAAHLVVDPSRLINGYGQQYAIPSVPSTLSGDHPPVELGATGVGVTATGAVLGAPGAGYRYRVFALQLAPWTGTLFGFLEDNISGEVLLAGGPGAPGQLQIPLTGLPLSTNGPLGFTVGGGAGEMIAVVYYTTETV